MRKLKGLEDIVPVVYVNTVMNDSRRSWSFKKVVYPDRPHLGIPGTVPEPLYNLQDLRELYEKHSKGAEVEPPFPVRSSSAFCFRYCADESFAGADPMGQEAGTHCQQ